MFKSTGMLSRTLLSLIIVSATISSNSVVSAATHLTHNHHKQETPPSSHSSGRRLPPPQTTHASLIEDLEDVFQRRPRDPNITRGGSNNVCLVSPGTLDEDGIVWSDRPLFLWLVNGEASQIQAQRVRVIDDSQEVLWQTSLMETDQSAVYEGVALQPDQSYSWRLRFNAQTPGQSVWESNEVQSTFQIMDAEKRDQIAVELDALTSQLAESKADAEAIALQQATFFAERGLRSDALRVLYALENPSPEMQQMIQNLLTFACSADDTLL